MYCRYRNPFGSLRDLKVSYYAGKNKLRSDVRGEITNVYLEIIPIHFIFFSTFSPKI